MGSDLQVIAGLQLPIHHWIFLHTHEGRIVVSFWNSYYDLGRYFRHVHTFWHAELGRCLIGDEAF
uniref:hypothetical protein n=1 Tax=Limosilactobacillus reuteri TaxID=1598 RepID=UPI0035D0FC7F